MRLYIVDDDPAVARTVARAARAIAFETRCFESPGAFLANLDALEDGCVILDIGMPDITGLDLLDLLKDQRPQWPVIMLTGRTDAGSAVHSFRSGAVHFLSKPFRRAELLSALEEAAQVGERRLRAAIDPTQVEAFDKLTRRERQVLAAISDGRQSKVIAWDLGISVRTVDLYRSNILAKLSARNTAQAVALAKAVGFAKGA